MNKLLDIIINKELDNLLKEEYSTINEANPFEDVVKAGGVVTTPIERLGTYPLRAIRYRKTKAVIKKYESKISSRVDKIIKKFIQELDKSVPEITKRSDELQTALKTAREEGNEDKEESLITQIKKFNDDVKSNQNSRIDQLNQSIETLIQSYSEAINKRIENPGYIIKVELSDRGKADLKFLWEEKVASLRQDVYEKLIKIINDKNLKGLEAIQSDMEVQISKIDKKRESIEKQRKKLNAREGDFEPKLIENLENRLSIFFNAETKILIKKLGKHNFKRYAKNKKELAETLVELMLANMGEHEREINTILSKTISNQLLSLLLTKYEKELEHIGVDKVDPKKEKEKILKKIKFITDFYEDLKEQKLNASEITFRLISLSNPDFKEVLEEMFEAGTEIMSFKERVKIIKQLKPIWKDFQHSVKYSEEKYGSEIIKMVKQFLTPEEREEVFEGFVSFKKYKKYYI